MSRSGGSRTSGETRGILRATGRVCVRGISEQGLRERGESKLRETRVGAVLGGQQPVLGDHGTHYFSADAAADPVEKKSRAPFLAPPPPGRPRLSLSLGSHTSLFLPSPPRAGADPRARTNETSVPDHRGVGEARGITSLSESRSNRRWFEVTWRLCRRILRVLLTFVPRRFPGAPFLVSLWVFEGRGRRAGSTLSYE